MKSLLVKTPNEELKSYLTRALLSSLRWYVLSESRRKEDINDLVVLLDLLEALQE